MVLQITIIFMISKTIRLFRTKVEAFIFLFIFSLLRSKELSSVRLKENENIVLMMSYYFLQYQSFLGVAGHKKQLKTTNKTTMNAQQISR